MIGQSFRHGSDDIVIHVPGKQGVRWTKNNARFVAVFFSVGKPSFKIPGCAGDTDFLTKMRRYQYISPFFFC